MIVPYEWLKQYVDCDLDAPTLAERLTMLGFEVESTETIADEPVFTVKVTANRGDCLSMMGLAREVAAITGGAVHPPAPQLKETGPPIAEQVSVTLEAPDLCPRYSARLITGVKVGPSPEWVQRRLSQFGARSINNVVDATNLVMLELGQPLHAFDFDLVRGARIIVRRARPGERLITLDGTGRLLNEKHLVIADAERPIALAGVMGGANTEVVESTTRVLIESAHFNRVSVRGTSKALGVETEASYRMQRIVDPGGTVTAVDRVAELIAEWSGGEIAQGVVDEKAQEFSPRPVELRPARCNQILGLDLSPAEMADCLRRLQLPVEEVGDVLVVMVPTYRPDLTCEIDLIEEVIRVYGYERLPVTMPTSPTVPGRRQAVLEWADRARRVMRGAGFCEMMSYSLTGPQDPDLLGLPEGHPLRPMVAVSNPKSEEFSVLRTNLFGDLFAALANNARRGVDDVQVFELGRVFLHPGAAVEPGCDPLRATVIERRALGGALMGSPWTSAWNADPHLAQADFFLLKGLVDELAREFIGECLTYEAAVHPCLHPGRSAIVRLGGEELGWVGEAHPELRARYDIPSPAYVFEIDFDLLVAHARGEASYRPLSRFPAVGRDLALVVPEGTPAARVEAIIAEAGGDLIERIRLFDLYQGEQVPAGHKSLAYSLVLRAPDRTLVDEEVSGVMAAITVALSTQIQAQIRQ